MPEINDDVNLTASTTNDDANGSEEDADPPNESIECDTVVRSVDIGIPGNDVEIPTINDDEEPSSPPLSNPDVAANVDVVSTEEMPRRKSKALPDCVNIQCSGLSNEFIEAPQYVLSHYRVNKKTKTIYVCDDCYDAAVEVYEKLCSALEDHQPLLCHKFPSPPELVEILDSSDEETDENGVTAAAGEFEQQTLDLIASDLEQIISDTFSRVNIDQQMKWSHSILAQQIEKQEREAQEINESLRSIQQLADAMHSRLYQSTSIFIEEMPSWDSTTNNEVQLADANYPPGGEYIPAPVDTVSLFYSVRQKMLAAWAPCRVIDLPVVGSDKPQYKVKFLRPIKNVLTKSVAGIQLAYGTAPKVRLHVGARVIALFNMSATNENRNLLLPTKEPHRFSFFPGIVAEPLQKYNGWRYLIFFDDGYTQYVQHENVRVVCERSAKVWENVHPASSEFIRQYLEQFNSQRPMVQVRLNQRMQTELNGKWLNAKVSQIDGSLVRMVFDEGKRVEWIYRGSTRLAPLFREHQQQMNKMVTPSTPGKRSDPAIEYITIDDHHNPVSEKRSTDQPTTPSQRPKQAQRPSIMQQIQQQQQQQQEQDEKDQEQTQADDQEPKMQQEPVPEPAPQPEKRAVARKSTARPAPTVNNLNNATIYVDDDNKPKGKVVYYTAKRHLPPRKFDAHICAPTCLYTVTYNLSSYSPLSKPLLSGWERQICKSKSKKMVIYRAPCGRRLRNMIELHRYLRLTNCSLNVENFDFDYSIHCLAEYVIEKCIIQKSVSIIEHATRIAKVVT